MLVAHLGIGVFIVGVTLVKGYEIERDVRSRRADAPRSAAGRSRSGVETEPGPNYQALAGTVDVRRGGGRRRCSRRSVYATRAASR